VGPLSHRSATPVIVACCAAAIGETSIHAKHIEDGTNCRGMTEDLIATVLTYTALYWSRER